MGMFTHLEIRGFRAFDNFEIARLDRINLFTGRNNSGKTSLLEALFLLCGAGNPHLALNPNVVRHSATDPAAVPETFWKPMFTGLDMTRSVEIKGHHESHGVLALTIKREQMDHVDLSIEGAVGASGTEPGNSSALLFSYQEGTRSMVNGRVRLMADGGVRIDSSASPPVAAVFLSTRNLNLQEDAVRLGQLRKRKQGELLASALRTVDPRLRSVEDNSASGVPMIWADVGLSEFVPLLVLGEGMTRIARLILAISAAPGGVVLVDEMENGLHHSILSKVWRAVDQVAGQFNTQVFASTHSFECSAAAHQSLDAASLGIHRLEEHAGTIRCISYSSEEARAAISHDLEIR